MLPNDGRVISNFIVQAINGNSLTVYGDGSQTRSFCYIDDLVEGLTKLMNSDYIGPINLGNPEEFTINQLAEVIRNKINQNLKIKYLELPKDDPMQRKPDINLAINKLKWMPKIFLEEGLNKTIKYFNT